MGCGTARPTQAIDPPYENLPETEADPQLATSGRGIRMDLTAQGQDRSLVAPGAGMSPLGEPAETRSAGRGTTSSNLLNGTERHPFQGRAAGERSEMRQAGPQLSQGADSSLEQLVQQLLTQNAALQQELLEGRGSSGSVSTGSVDGRQEGRGSVRSGQSDVGSFRRVGSERVLEHHVTWTSFAPSPEATYSLAASMRPMFEAEGSHLTTREMISRDNFPMPPAQHPVLTTGLASSTGSNLGVVNQGPSALARSSTQSASLEPHGRSVRMQGPSIIVDAQEEDRIPLHVQHWKAPPVSRTELQ